MLFRIALILLACLLPLGAQTAITVEQLRSFIKSAVQRQHKDKQVAEYLGKMKLSERLEPQTLAELEGMGVGEKTSEALRRMAETSRSLPPPPPPPVKAPSPGIAPPSPAEQQRIIEEARAYAMNYVKRLPDFICTQVTRRYYDPSGMEFWQSDDVIVERLTYFEQKEDYKVITINSRPTNISHYNLGGASSSGEFGSLLKEVFDPKTATRFEWERWARLRGRRMHVYAYRVARVNSQWHIEYQRQERITPAYRGLVYIDAQTNAIMRLTLDAEDIPVSFPIQQAYSMLDYDFQRIGESDYVLPLRAVVRMRQGKLLTKNEVEFRMYRKFGAEAVIKFDTPEPLPPEQTQEQPLKP